VDGSSLTGTPCYDDTAVAPGAVYTYTAYDGADPNTAAVLYRVPLPDQCSAAIKGFCTSE